MKDKLQKIRRAGGDGKPLTTGDMFSIYSMIRIRADYGSSIELIPGVGEKLMGIQDEIAAAGVSAAMAGERDETTTAGVKTYLRCEKQMLEKTGAKKDGQEFIALASVFAVVRSVIKGEGFAPLPPPEVSRAVKEKIRGLEKNPPEQLRKFKALLAAPKGQRTRE